MQVLIETAKSEYNKVLAKIAAFESESPNPMPQAAKNILAALKDNAQKLWATVKSALDQDADIEELELQTQNLLAFQVEDKRVLDAPFPTIADEPFWANPHNAHLIF